MHNVSSHSQSLLQNQDQAVSVYVSLYYYRIIRKLNGVLTPGMWEKRGDIDEWVKMPGGKRNVDK